MLARHTSLHFKTLFLILGLFIISCGPKGSEASAQTKEVETVPVVQDIDIAKFDELRADKTYTVVDVRTPGEIADGKVPGAMEIDYNGDNFEAAIGELDRSKHYLVYCRSGGRSASASQLMTDKGFEHVYNLLGGYNAWSEAHNNE